MNNFQRRQPWVRRIHVIFIGYLWIACKHNGCVKALSSIRRDADVAPKYLLRSLVTRKKKDSLERALEAKERRRKQRKKE